MILEQPPFELTPVFEWNYNCTKPIVINQGGTNSGKTYSILQVLFCRLAEKENQVCTVVGQDIPNLKIGAMREFEKILDSTVFFRMFIKSYNKTERTYIFTNGSQLEFKSYEDYQDAKSGKRDYAFFNEANGISYDIYEEVQIRTTKQVFLDYNPTVPFWAHTKLIGLENVQLFISNFQHNTFLDESIRTKILNYKTTNPERWKVYGLGKTGKTEGVVFSNVNWISEMPTDLKRKSYGMDFGYSNDPTTLVKCGVYNGELFAEKWLYRTGMTTKDIDSEFKKLGVSKKDYIFADSADPRMIRELRDLGWNVIKAKKGADSITFGISEIKKYEALNIVHCEEWKQEQISYTWAKDARTGNLDNKPIDSNNHLWDALRYGIQGLNKTALGVNYS